VSILGGKALLLLLELPQKQLANAIDVAALQLAQRINKV